jgi:hypothetical protein
MNTKKTMLVGALTLMIPGHTPPTPPEAAERPLVAIRNRERPLADGRKPDNTKAPTDAEKFYRSLTESMNPRFSLYEEKNPVILVVERDSGDHKAEVIRVIQSTYGSDNPPRIVYLNSNLLDNDAGFAFQERLAKEGISLSSVRAANFSMGAWFDSSTPTSALPMRRNIALFNDTIFVHGAGNMEGGQPIYGLTTQSDHCLVVGATKHARHEKPNGGINKTDFTASSVVPTSAVDLVMKGEDVPIDGVSGRWSKSGKDEPDARKITGTSFAAPQVTAAAAKVAARTRDLYVGGLPGRRFKDELTIESIRAKDERRRSFVDAVNMSLLASASPADASDKAASITPASSKLFDTKGAGFGMPDVGVAERIMFDQMLAAQLSGRVIPEETYQAYAPESTQVYPRTKFADAREENTAMARDPFRYIASVRVPVQLKTQVLEGEENALYVDIPPFDKNLSTHLIRGSLLFEVEPKSDKKKPEALYELFMEAPDGKTRMPLGSFSPRAIEELWHEDKPHPIDQFRLVNFRTRAHMMGESSPAGAERGFRLIVKTTNKSPADVKVFASGNPVLPVLEVVGVEHERDMFTHHPAAASHLGFLSRHSITESYKDALERLEDKLDNKKPAQAIIEDFIEGKSISPSSLMKALPDLAEACKGDDKLQQAFGLIIHNGFVEPVARNCAERLMHLAHHYEKTKSDKLAAITSAYSDLYLSVLNYEKALVSGDYQKLAAITENMDKQVNAAMPHMADYGRNIPQIFGRQPLAMQEQKSTQAVYRSVTGESLVLPPLAAAELAR